LSIFLNRRIDCRGGIADGEASQGLGKTIQAIAFLAAVMGSKSSAAA
jgi:hypothetical protein